MLSGSKINTELITFAQSFDENYENEAVSTRGQFLQSYPLSELKNITLDNYVVGKGTASFCACVESKTRAWANIQGATANKFGIYFGKTKSDSLKQYRFTKKFGKTEKEAFDGVRAALLDLVRDGELLKFGEIDKNPLSQMFKAKILSLYYPNLYLNVCSAEHIELFSFELGVSEPTYTSEYQHLLVKFKLGNEITKDWSNPKFMRYLYAKFINRDLNNKDANTLKKPRNKARHEVNFEEIIEIRNAIGKMSEDFAIEWEKNRLIGLGYKNLAEKIEDRTKIPSYGYDFLSYSESGVERYIEVKSVKREGRGQCFRFFLSENERSISESKENGNNYYFYLVIYGKDGKPCEVVVKQAKELYSKCELIPCSYAVRFDLEAYD